MKSHARIGILLATVAGLAAAGWAFGSAGIAEIIRSAGRVGIGGLLLYCGYSLAVFGLLGGAWLAAAPGEDWRRLPVFAWARMMREAVADLLPFSQIGGIVVGARALTAARVPLSRVCGSLVVDMTTEMAGQLVYTLFGLAMIVTLLAADGAAASLRPMILGGTGVMIVVILLFFSAQHLALDFAGGIARRFLPGSVAALVDVRAELARIYARRGRVLLAFALNLAAWVASGVGAWIVLRLMGVSISVWDVLSLESLIFTLRSVAFVIPGAIGVQEAAYVLAAPLFGLPPETALALSLVKRTREIAIGLPTLLIWQIGETRAVTARA